MTQSLLTRIRLLLYSFMMTIVMCYDNDNKCIVSRNIEKTFFKINKYRAGIEKILAAKK